RVRRPRRNRARPRPVRRTPIMTNTHGIFVHLPCNIWHIRDCATGVVVAESSGQLELLPQQIWRVSMVEKAAGFSHAIPPFGQDGRRTEHDSKTDLSVSPGNWGSPPGLTQASPVAAGSFRQNRKPRVRRKSKHKRHFWNSKRQKERWPTSIRTIPLHSPPLSNVLLSFRTGPSIKRCSM